MRSGYLKIRAACLAPRPAVGLAAFRVLYAAVLFLEIAQLFRFRYLLAADNPAVPEAWFTGLILTWAVALGMLLLGYKTGWAGILNYLVSVAVIWGLPNFKYHLDYLVLSINFLLIFLPVSTGFSLDQKWQIKTGRGISAFFQKEVPAWSGYLLAGIPLGLVYFDSALHKLSSGMWVSGLGFWLPASLPPNVYFPLNFILDNRFLSLGLGYGSLAFELVFIFLIWFRPIRPALVFAGILMHLFIGLAFPIPHFAWVMMTLYLPLLPPKFWATTGKWFQANPSGTSLPEVPVFRIPRRISWLVAGLLAYWTIGQMMCSLVLAPPTDFSRGLQNLYKPFYYLNRHFLGIVPHDIFHERYFQDYTQLITLVYQPPQGDPIPLPLLGAEGRPGAYLRGRVWTKWAYRVTGPPPDQERLEAGIRNFTRFWALENKVNLTDAVFEVRVKPIAVPDTWEPDFLRRQEERIWLPVGRAVWRNQRFTLMLSPEVLNPARKIPSD